MRVYIALPSFFYSVFNDLLNSISPSQNCCPVCKDWFVITPHDKRGKETFLFHVMLCKTGSHHICLTEFAEICDEERRLRKLFGKPEKPIFSLSGISGYRSSPGGW